MRDELQEQPAGQEPERIRTAAEIWDEFLAVTGEEKTVPPEAWAFGVDADELLGLVLSGKKTATASPAELYEAEGEPLPRAGARSIILDAAGCARCIIATIDVRVVPFSQVPAEHAYLEGEGDRSLAFWRRAHEKAFVSWLAEAGIAFCENSPVVLERFKVLYKRA